MSLGEIDHDMAEDFRSFLKNQNKKWLKTAVPCWSYRLPNKLPLLYILRGTSQYFYSMLIVMTNHTKWCLACCLINLILH